MIKIIIFFSIGMMVFSSYSQAATVPLKNVQMKCNDETIKNVIAIGNDNDLTSMQTEMIVYKSGKIVERSHQTMVFVQTSKDAGKLKIASESTELIVNLYVHPFSWSAGNVNGKAVKCMVNPIFMSSIWMK